MSTVSRIRVATIAAAAFAGGLAVSSGLGLTPFGHAQQKTVTVPENQVKPLTETGNAFVTIADRITPAVVSIETRIKPRPQRQGQRIPPGLEPFLEQFGPAQPPRPQEGSGSGFIVSSDGYILTNNHVVEDAERVTVALHDKHVYEAKVVGRDPSTDVAVIKIDAKDLPTLPLGNDDEVRVGEWVLAVGNPLTLDFTVTAGIVSAKHRSAASLRELFQGDYAIVDYIQTDAAINPGNSGGPLVNARGEVIGINSAIASPTGLYAGYGFAIPISLAKSVMNDLIKYGEVKRGILGVVIGDVSPEDAQSAGLKKISGAIVEAFPTNTASPARDAGLKPGDIIVSIGDEPVDRVSELQRIVREKKPGETVEVGVMRFGDKKSFKVKLAAAAQDGELASAGRNESGKSNDIAFDKLGVEVEALTTEQASQASLSEEERGVVVTAVDPEGPAYDQGIGRGMVITNILNPMEKRIKTVADLDASLDKLKKGEIVTLYGYSLGDPTHLFRVVNVRVN
jgi:serine protease Do